MRLTAKIEGRDAVLRRLRQLVPDAERELAKAQIEVADELANRIKPRAPGPRTGEYQASIQGDRLANRPGKRAIVKGLKGQTKDPNATGVFADFIWRFLEFGTVKMAARPHIFPTYRAYRKKLRRRMAGAVNKAVRRARKG
ncbi:MAG: HK97-gp10 family putative phage morphogenesis protein [Mesorhizobium sp.]